MATLAAAASLLYGQFFVTLPIPTTDFSGQTIIVTGGNTGLGYEAAKHLLRLNASSIILAVRDISKGEAAKASLEQASGRQGIVQVWEVDLSRFDSVRAFANGVVQKLPRLDALLCNAGISTTTFSRSPDGHESSLTTNVLSTFLLAWLLVPKLRETAHQVQGSTTTPRPRITIVSSALHHFAPLTAQHEHEPSPILAAMDDPERSRMRDRYADTKLMEVLYGRQMAAALDETSSKDALDAITLNIVNPGYCVSSLGGVQPSLGARVGQRVLARSTEEGSRALVHGIGAGPDTHGLYLSACRPAQVSKFVRSSAGAKVQERVWAEVNAVLESVVPGVTSEV